MTSRSCASAALQRASAWQASGALCREDSRGMSVLQLKTTRLHVHHPSSMSSSPHVLAL
jgi:hypothetical protein